jgi:hypothetical protein
MSLTATAVAANDKRIRECAMSDNWQDQITDYFDGSPTQQEALRLNKWIRSDPQNVRRFVREAIVHSHWYDLLNDVGPYADKPVSK